MEWIVSQINFCTSVYSDQSGWVQKSSACLQELWSQKEGQGDQEKDQVKVTTKNGQGEWEIGTGGKKGRQDDRKWVNSYKVRTVPGL